MNRFQMMDIADKVTQDILIVGANKVQSAWPFGHLGGA